MSTAHSRLHSAVSMLLGRMLLVVAPVVFAATPGGADPVIGAWGPRFPLPLITIHASLIPNGKVLLFSSRGAGAGSESWLWDPDTGGLTDVSVPYSYDMMCGGNTLLSDGEMFVAGGRLSAARTAVFNSVAQTWDPGPSMADNRYYPTAIQLADERVFIFYGRNSTVEVYDPKAKAITQLPPSANRIVGLYPRLHVMPDGRIFQAGQEASTWTFDPATSTWSPMGQMSTVRNNGSTVLLPGLTKIMAVGGNAGAKVLNTAEIIDFSAATPAWRPTSNMHLARQHLNTVLLPDGTVLVVGGRGGSVVPRQAELFDPVTETWTLMAAQVAQRAYHSTAILLPDGRVLSSGDGQDGNSLTGEIYSPPYLFKGARPTIGSVTPSSLGYGEALTISTSDAGSIQRVAMIRPGPASHGVNFDQRYVGLEYTVGDGNLVATLPNNPHLVPPGWYMLFILNSAGVPSVASWVHVASVGGLPCVAAAPTVSAAPMQGPGVQSGTTVPYVISVRNNDSATCATSGFDLQATVPDGWQGAFAAPNLTIAPGVTATSSLDVASAPASPPGAYTIVATAARTGTPTSSGSVSPTYTVAPAGAGGAFTDDFSGTALGSDWQVIEGTLAPQDGELRNGAVAGLHRAVVPALVGASQTLTASFATSQNTGTPTLGLILRYQNPMNYYMLYRQVGGSSLLRITKVVNGVTTVLGSTAIPNPQANTAFAMTASAAGSTLTLTQGSRSVSVADATFPSGGVGIVMGSLNGAISHRADDFSASTQ